MQKNIMMIPVILIQMGGAKGNPITLVGVGEFVLRWNRSIPILILIEERMLQVRQLKMQAVDLLQNRLFKRI